MADNYEDVDGGTPGGGESSPVGEILEIASIVAHQLQDELNVNWPTSKILPYFNLAIIEIIVLKPDAYTVTKNISLVPGVIQALPDGAFMLIDAVCNMGVDGATIGKEIRSLDKQTLDYTLPGWMIMPAAEEVLFIVKDNRNPKTFYVFPPEEATSPKQQIQVVLSQAPDPITNETLVCPLDASFRPALIDYLIYRCLIEETTIPGAQAKATAFYNKFLQDLGLKTNVEKQTEAKGA